MVLTCVARISAQPMRRMRWQRRQCKPDCGFVNWRTSQQTGLCEDRRMVILVLIFAVMKFGITFAVFAGVVNATIGLFCK